jgi:hypothetical protein
MELINWAGYGYVWGDDADDPVGLNFTHEMNFPPGTYSASCGISQLSPGPTDSNTLWSNARIWISNYSTTQAPDSGSIGPYFLPTDDVIQLLFAVLINNVNWAVVHINVFGWK